MKHINIEKFYDFSLFIHMAIDICRLKLCECSILNNATSFPQAFYLNAEYQNCIASTKIMKIIAHIMAYSQMLAKV